MTVNSSGSSGHRTSSVRWLAAAEASDSTRRSDAVTAQAVRERLLARDHVVLQRNEVKQPAGDFMTVAHVGRMLSQCRDRSVAGKSVEDETPGANGCGYRRQD